MLRGNKFMMEHMTALQEERADLDSFFFTARENLRDSVQLNWTSRDSEPECYVFVLFIYGSINLI